MPNACFVGDVNSRELLPVSIRPKDVTTGSHKKVWWLCSNDHEWEAVVSDRSGERGCPYCAGHKVNDENCLQTVNPTLVKEWHPTKNGNLKPTGVTAGSNRKAWWLCSRDHEWEAKVSHRNKGRGCPYCAGQKVNDENCLQTVNPALAKEWHPTKNGNLKPTGVTVYSHRKVWWLCSKDHEWEAVVYGRNNENGCPYCSNTKVNDENWLQTFNPALAKEWHPIKNGDLTPRT